MATRPNLALVAYMFVVALGTVGILVAVRDPSAGNGLVATWLAFCGIGGVLGVQQAGTHQTVQRLANGEMEAKIRNVIGQELSAYHNDPAGYVASTVAQDPTPILGVAAPHGTPQGPPRATPRPAHRRAAP